MKAHKKILNDCSNCEHCLPIGGGDHICDAYNIPVLILDGYNATDDYYKCNGKEWRMA